MTAAIYEWVDRRLGVHEVIAFAKKKTVPVHAHSFWYYWGGLSLFFFIVQVLTGILLLVYYRPGADAYESVRQITFQMQFGWLIRSAHSWSANLMIFAIFVHMFSAFFMKAYRNPREFGWFSGLGLLAIVMVFGFSGYLLPMDELSYFATKVGLQIPGSIPVIGPMLADMVRGGPDVSEFTVQRFFALHVVVLPAIFVPLLVFHLWLVQKHGNAVPEKDAAVPVDRRKSEPFYPNFVAKDMAMWLIALNVLAVFASLLPWSLGKPADPLVPAPAGIHPEWYFMSPFQSLKWMGNLFPGVLGDIIGMVFFNLLLVAWAIIPLYDTSALQPRRSRVAWYFGLFLLAGMAVTTIGGYWGVRG